MPPGRRPARALWSSPPLPSGRSTSFPRNQPALQLVDDQERDEPDERDHYEPHVHPLDLEGLPCVPDQGADAGACPDDLRNHDEEERVAPAEPKPREDQRERARQSDSLQELPPPGAVVLGHIEIDRLD